MNHGTLVLPRDSFPIGVGVWYNGVTLSGTGQSILGKKVFRTPVSAANRDRTPSTYLRFFSLTCGASPWLIQIERVEMKLNALAALLLIMGVSTSYGQVRGIEAGSAEAASALAEYRNQLAEADEAWRNSTKLSNLAVMPKKPRGQLECISVDELRADSVGYLEYWQFEVLQVVGPNDVLLTMRNTNPPLVWLSGHPTKDLVDGDNVRLVGPIEVDGTKKYTTVAGASKTVRVIRLISAEKIAEVEKEKTRLADDKLFRTWTSTNGEFTIEAKFLDFRGGKLHLEKRDGKTIEVSPQQISKDDRDHYRDLLKNRRQEESRVR